MDRIPCSFYNKKRWKHFSDVVRIYYYLIFPFSAIALLPFNAEDKNSRGCKVFLSCKCNWGLSLALCMCVYYLLLLLPHNPPCWGFWLKQLRLNMLSLVPHTRKTQLVQQQQLLCRKVHMPSNGAWNVFSFIMGEKEGDWIIYYKQKGFISNGNESWNKNNHLQNTTIFELIDHRRKFNYNNVLRIVSTLINFLPFIGHILWQDYPLRNVVYYSS